MTDQAIEIWAEALGDVLAFCIAPAIRELVEDYETILARSPLNRSGARSV